MMALFHKSFVVLFLFLATTGVTAASATWLPPSELAQDGPQAPYQAARDPLLYRELQLVAPDGRAEDYFGHSVAIDGDTAQVGAYYQNVGENARQGAAYVFTRSKMGWSLQQKLLAPDGEAVDFFGLAVALSGDTALVGAPRADIGGNLDQGAAYVFTREGSVWSRQTKLLAFDGAAGHHFGQSVALSGDTALVGAPTYNAGAQASQGAAYGFTRQGQSWTTQRWDAPIGAAGDHFGWSVALDGDTALVGAPQDRIGDNSVQGSAYLFALTATGWYWQGQLLAPDGAADDYFGESLALDGGTALVGAPGDDLYRGAAYVFSDAGASWSYQGKLTSPDGKVADQFGLSLALDGDTALVGAPHEIRYEPGYRGAVYIFAHSGTGWTFQQQLLASDGAAGDEFGQAVALDGGIVLAGAPEVNVGENYNQGMLYLFEPDPAPTVVAITRASANPTSAASVAFDVTFTKAMTGVDAEDFALTTTGTLGGVSVSSVSGSGASYVVTVATGKGAGTLRLDVPATASMTDLAGQQLSELPYTSGEVYLIERVTVHLPFLWREG